MNAILIVEDSKSLAALFKARIEQVLGLPVVLVHSFSEARAAMELHQDQFSLALLDLNLPDSPDGEIVDYTQSRGIPIIVLTGSYQANVRVHVQKKGVLDYFVKDNIGTIDSVLHAVKRIRHNKWVRILVVDDSRSVRSMIVHFLAQYGFILEQAEDGRQALELIAKQPVDLVITDYEMPGMDGLAMTKKLRTRYSRNDVAVIGLSSHADQNLAVQFIKAGASDFLSKPYQPEEMLCRVYQNIDIIERHRELEHLVERHQSVLTSALDAIISSDENGIVLDYNPAAETLFGFARNTVLGHSVTLLIANPGQREQCEQELARFRVDGVSSLRRRLEIQGLRADGKIIDLQVALIANVQQGRIRYTAFVQDITDRKQLLVSLNETLFTAESANKAKSDFIANMSHEIRTPMNAVIGYADLALKHELPPRIQDYLEKISAASHSLMGVINDILDFSKMEAGRMEIDPVKFDLHQLLDRLANLFSKQATDKGLELIFLAPYTFDSVLWGDAIRLEQVLINLIRNAIKFTERGSVLVEAIPQVLENNQVLLHFEVRDTGIGIAPSVLPNLFAPFIQADSSTTRKFGGTGLGLSICKRLINLLEGEIWAESVPGRGSIFAFEVRLGVHSENRRVALGFPLEYLGQRVLVVEEHPGLAKQLSGMITAIGLNPLVVDNGTDALAQIVIAEQAGEPFLFTLIEWQLEGNDGNATLVELLASLHALPDPPKPPLFLLLTPFGVESVRIEGEKAGFDGFLDKPITRAMLIKTLLQTLGMGVKEDDRRSHVALGLEKDVADKVGGGRILLVDTNSTVVRIACDLMERVGLVVETVADAPSAIRLAERYPYDALLFDVHLAEWDGSKLARRIRQIPNCEDLPLVAMTEHALASEKQSYLTAGANALLDKPIRAERLYGLLNKWLARNRLPPPWVGTEGTLAITPIIAGVDVREGVERLGGNLWLYRRLLARFRQEFGDKQELFSEAMTTGLVGQAAPQWIHTAQGLARLLGAVELAKAAEACERSLALSDPESRQADYLVFFNQLQRLLKELGVAGSDALTAHLEQEALTPGAIDHTQASDLVSELAVLLENHALELDGPLNRLSELLEDTPLITTFRQLLRQVEGYHFDEALDLLRHLATSMGVTLTSMAMVKSQRAERVLIVDDQLSNIDVLKEILVNFRRAVASNGRQALRVAQSDDPPDLILLDVMMPEMNGFEVCRRLKDDPKTRDIPIIFVTAKKEAVDEEEGFAVGGVDYITKPFRSESILRRVSLHLELKRHRERLQDEVRQRTWELEQAREEAERRKDAAEAGNQAKSRFLATMSHEIRTPMNAILGMAEILRETALSDEQQQYVTVFRQAGERLLGLINDVLDLSKVEAGRLVLERKPFALTEILREVCMLMEKRALEKGLQFIQEFDPLLPQWVEGDGHRLQQVLLNLLDNAIKFTHKGTVTVRASTFASMVHAVKIEVLDSGIGFPPDKRKEIFDGFVQADSSITRRYGGSGLGLTICQRLTLLMKGKIGARSTEGLGSAFYVIIPLPPVDPPLEVVAAPVVRHGKTGTPASVLLVEDGDDNILLIQVFLKNTPHRLTVALNGQEAVEMFQKGHFDLVLMDLQMPVKDGFTATKEIRDIELARQTPPVPIFALTACAFQEDLQRATESGCNDFITKPLAKQQLLAVINTVMNPPTPENVHDQE